MQRNLPNQTGPRLRPAIFTHISFAMPLERYTDATSSIFWVKCMWICRRISILLSPPLFLLFSSYSRFYLFHLLFYSTVFCFCSCCCCDDALMRWRWTTYANSSGSLLNFILFLPISIRYSHTKASRNWISWAELCVWCVMILSSLLLLLLFSFLCEEHV